MDKEASIQVALAFIKKWERLASTSPSKLSYFSNTDSLSGDTTIYSYKDADAYSIGWGTYNKLSDGTPINKSTTITKSDADFEIENEIRNTIIPVYDGLITAPLNETQYAALLSFGYNAGPYAIKYNNLIDIINSGGDVQSILKRTAITDKGTGKVSKGIQNRRIDEAQLYSGNYNDLYSYYLRNSGAINYALVGVLIISITAYVYYLKKKKIY